MIRQLVKGIFTLGLPAAPSYPVVPTGDLDKATEAILIADPLDLTLYIEQFWDSYSPSAGPARRNLWASGRFSTINPPAPIALPNPPGDPGVPSWDHLAYSYVLENTRASQILRRVVREYRSGEGLGVPSPQTRRWLESTEALLHGAGNLIAPWLSTSAARQDAEGVRRNAYWRLLGMDLAFGTEDNRPADYVKASAANTDFIRLFEELLYELWRAISNIKNLVAGNETDQDRIFRIAQELQFVLRSRRLGEMLDREELAAATVLGWIELTLSNDNFVVTDLKAQSTSSANRLRLIGNRVGLQAHSKSAALLSMSEHISILLRTIESAVITEATVAMLYQPGLAIGEATRRVITEWSAATGRDLKARAKPVEMSRPRLVSVQ
ncbi:hypothetical protein [Pararobbsia alpina]|uniref:Uncharacterized protein n=1 Tax=Pararobbsia alpina TaxID=621374 RepID=A0A6S7B4L6_9BURK|nr:hypothetical protein [Pararobbsia alpina]CAB3787603.1 hypothetical protein LMG28138_02455 [Pararobbsia alpina]